jgi:16S rRNA (uracil1498-N3)-methyltransferase
MPGSLAQAMADLPATARRLLLDPQATQGMRKLDLAAGGIVLAIGPEGGWSARDLASLRGNGFEGLRLGPRVLRTETAGIAAVAALQACHGDFA